MEKFIRIGTRDSQLAIWQGKKVQEKLEEQGIQSELIFIKSDGDIDSTRPLYKLGVQGIFTKALDAALLNKEIDMAVHSYKDVPTTLAKDTVIAAVLERDTCRDVLISKEPMEKFIYNDLVTIATSSTRRRAQWLNKFQNHSMENIRGNINSRLKKLEENKKLNGTILSKAGVDRINLEAPYITTLDWMLPAPSQGAIVITAMQYDEKILDPCQRFNHKPTEICTGIEKDFLKFLMGGCSTPIAALALFKGNKIFFYGNVLSLDGKRKAEVEMYFEKTDFEKAGELAANKLRENGGEEILKELKNINQNMPPKY